jgi:hypothetical protein
MGKQGLERRKGSNTITILTLSTTVNGSSSDSSDRSDRDESGWGGSHTWRHVTSICSTRNEGLRAQTGSLVSGHGMRGEGRGGIMRREVACRARGWAGGHGWLRQRQAGESSG